MLGLTPLAYVEVHAEAMGQSVHTPTPVVANIDAVDISVGGDHVLLLARDGTVWAWGDGSKGQLGVGGLPVINFKTHTPRAMSFVPFPVHIPGLTDVVAISAGMDYSLALLKDGTMRAWGGNKFGQLGDGTTVDRTTPVPIRGIGNVIAMAASSGMFSLAVLEDGRVLSWGANTAANLGRPWRDNTPAPVPDFVPGVANARAVALGDGHALVLTNAGTVMSWGYNALGQLGYAGAAYGGAAARPVNGLSGVHSITALTHASLAVLTDGHIVGWGALRGRPWISLRDGSSDIKSKTSTPILLNVDGLDNGH
jgi:alpha-tubulin suppressor-like RCC1 family protein